MLIEQHENQNILIHDIKKHLQTILLLNEEEDASAVTTYVNQIISSPELRGSVKVSDNRILNSIFSRYIHLCRAKHIKLRPDIRSGCIDFVQEADLTALFCNLLDNAYESALRMEHSYIDISISKRELAGLTLLSMINSCRVDPFDSKTGKLITHKEDKMRHGYGVRSINKIVKKYGGEMTMYYDKNNCTFHTIITLREDSQKPKIYQ
jgi:sensor histidine kinase regulating citrate/malate metabolism